MAENGLDLATLLRWLTRGWTSQRYCDGRQEAGPRNAAAMADKRLDLAAVLRWPATRCSPGQHYAASFLFFFFFTRQLQEKKRMGEREKF